MTLHYQDDWLSVHLGDCREVLATLPAESVHCVVTSPPYWGLRDYGTATWLGGDEGCDHAPDKRGSRFATPVSSKQASNQGSGTISSRECPCGATRQDRQLGLEPTPEEYVANMVAVFREVRRVLRRDGTVWLNVGDSYAAGGGSSPQRLDELGVRLGTGGGKKHSSRPSGRAPSAGLAQKQLVGIPWRLAFALQADGWYLRSDIVWSKPNPMPESVTDRPTKAHEYVFLLSREARYYYDADAVREALSESTERIHGSPNVRTRGDGWKMERNADRQDGHSATLINGPERLAKMQAAGGRNLRSVWTIATQPYPGAHFATFPQALVEPCVKAGTSERGVCPACGSPWRRVVEREKKPVELRNAEKAHGGLGNNLGGQKHQDWLDAHPPQTSGWQPQCAHDGEPVPATVLDPFAGSGTVGLVAQRLRRKAVLVDLSDEYLSQALRRTSRQWGVGGKPERSPKPVPEDSWLAELAG